MSHWRTMGLLVVLIGLTHDVYGDLAPQRSSLPKPPLVAPVRIVEGAANEQDPDVAARIIIPSSLLPELLESSPRGQASQGSFSSGRTIVAGLALTVAAISLLFASRTGPHWRKGAIGLIVCVVLVGGMALVNSLLPPKNDSPSGDREGLQKRIVIEVQEHGHEVILMLPGNSVPGHE